MNILLTGGTGFIGSHLINEIHSRKFNIFSLKRKSSNSRIRLNKEPNWILDENEVELIETMKKCDIFVNCAAIGVSPQKASWNELINYNNYCNDRGINLCGVSKLPFEPRAGKLKEFVKFIWGEGRMKFTPQKSLDITKTEKGYKMDLFFPTSTKLKLYSESYKIDNIEYLIDIPDYLEGKKPKKTQKEYGATYYYKD